MGVTSTSAEAEIAFVRPPRRATTDAAERLKIYRQVNNILAKDLPYLLLNYFDNYSLVSAKVHDIPLVPDGLLRLQSVWKDQ